MSKADLDLSGYDDWLAEHFEEVVTAYPGKSIAVIGDEIVAVGETEKQVDQLAKKRHPGSIPFVFAVPSEKDLICLL